MTWRDVLPIHPASCLFRPMSVQTRPRNGIDLLALKKHFGAALKPFFTAREITQVWLQVRTQPREPQI